MPTANKTSHTPREKKHAKPEDAAQEQGKEPWYIRLAYVWKDLTTGWKIFWALAVVLGFGAYATAKWGREIKDVLGLSRVPEPVAPTHGAASADTPVTAVSPPISVSGTISGNAQIGGSGNVLHAETINSLGTPPRHVAGDSLKPFVRSVSPFKGTSVSFFLDEPDGETDTFVSELETALTAAGWDAANHEATGHQNGDRRSGWPVPGLRIEVLPGKHGDAAATALAKALRDAGVKVDGPRELNEWAHGGGTVQGGPGNPSAALLVTIGKNQ